MNHLSEGMQIAALYHTEMARELDTLRTMVSSTVQFVLRRLPDQTFRVLAVDEVLAEFRKLEDRRSWLEWPGVRIHDPLLGLPSNWAQLVNRLDEAAGQLGAELAARQEVDAELEALWTSTALVQNLVLDGADGPSSLAASLSTLAELLEG
jgi:hypothetical protein